MCALYSPIIQNSVPIWFDPRVVVKPSAPHRVPHLPVQILYLIAQAIPQPRWLFNLARANKESWAYLQPALYECEVTYEARLGHAMPYYNGASSYTLERYYGSYVRAAADQARRDGPGWDSDSDSGENNEEIIFQSQVAHNPIVYINGERTPENDYHTRCPKRSASRCVQCQRRIDIDKRNFYGVLPKDLLETNRRGLTALHWASIQGASALPVALKALRSAQAHQPSYIDGVGLMTRMYRSSLADIYEIPADLPPPLFLAVAHGNVAVCKALIEAGCDVNLLQGQGVLREDRTRFQMSFKIHKKCMRLKRRFNSALKCVCHPDVPREPKPKHFNDIDHPGCQTAGHVAIRYNQPEMLNILLRNGLDVHLGLHPLIREAVVEGHLPFVKTLLDHDPSLIHSRQWSDTLHWSEVLRWKETLIHIVPFMRQKAGSEDVRNGRLREMVAFLLDRGVDLDESDASGITALKAALTYVERAELKADNTAVLIALHAAEVLITMGAVWNEPQFTNGTRYDILERCVGRTVSHYRDTFYFHKRFHIDECEAFYREIRKGWGRLVKTIIEKAAVSLSQDISTAERMAIGESISIAFESLGRRFVEADEEICPSRHGPWATEAVGKLLLSTGVTPRDEEMKRWKGITLLRSYEHLSSDGDRSQWNFLLRDIGAEAERRRDDGSVRQDSGRQGRRRRARRGQSSARP